MVRPQAIHYPTDFPTVCRVARVLARDSAMAKCFGIERPKR